MTVEIRDVSFVYPNGSAALSGVTLSIGSAERIAIIGQNGAGKTTLAKLMNGLAKPTAGAVEIDGVSTNGRTTAQVARSVGYVFQNPDDQIFGADVRSELAYMPKYFKWDAETTEARIARAVELTDLGEHLDENPSDLPFAIKKFVGIAAILVNDCAYIVLDEPTAGLDAAGTARLTRLLDRLADDGVGVVAITHDMRFVVDTFRRVVVMASGQVVIDGQPEDVFSDDGALSAARLKRPESAQLLRDLGRTDTVLSIDGIAEVLT